MNLIIYVNANFQDEKMLVDVDENKVLLQGQYDDDKIDYKIAGYLQALKHLGIHNKEVKKEIIKESHSYYKKMEFQIDNDDDYPMYGR